MTIMMRFETLTGIQGVSKLSRRRFNDLVGFNVRDFPFTDARGEIMVETRDNVAAFLQDLVLCPNKAGLDEHEPKRMARTRLYEVYKLFEFERNKE